MRLRFDQLANHLKATLAPAYLLSGDEPLQMNEGADAIRAAARAAGYGSRRVLEADAHFDWRQLTHEAENLSLFADRKVVDLRIPTGKPGREGSTALAAWCQDPPPDTLLLVTLPKLDKSQLKSKWFKALDTLGVVVQIWPITGKALVNWLEQRLRQAGFQPEAEVARLLAERTEGNLLAARQEIEKLRLLHPPGPLTQEKLVQTIADSARYDVFTLVDAALEGDPRRCLRILAGLRGEGVAPPVVLWALAREVRSLATLKRAREKGTPLAQVLRQGGVWKSRQALVSRGLERLDAARWRALLGQCQTADALIKGVEVGDPWLQLERILLVMAGAGTLDDYWPPMATCG